MTKGIASSNNMQRGTQSHAQWHEMKQLMANATIRASWGRDSCEILGITKDFQSKQLNGTKVREIS